MDPFALIGLTRRPLLSEEEIGSAYRKLAGELHPDQAGGDAQAFRTLGEAAAILRNPARRLRELAGGPAGNQLPPEAAELFPKVASILQEADALVSQYAAASNALAKALLATPLKRFATELDQTLAQIQAWHTSLDQELEAMDRKWPKHHHVTMVLLADSFAYVLRWEGQLRERKLAMKSILG